MYTGGMSVSPHIVNHHSELDRFELVSIALDLILYPSFALHLKLFVSFDICKCFDVKQSLLLNVSTDIDYFIIL